MKPPPPFMDIFLGHFQNRVGQVTTLRINLFCDIFTYPDIPEQTRGIFQVINGYKRYRVCRQRTKRIFFIQNKSYGKYTQWISSVQHLWFK